LRHGKTFVSNAVFHKHTIKGEGRIMKKMKVLLIVLAAVALAACVGLPAGGGDPFSSKTSQPVQPSQPQGQPSRRSRGSTGLDNAITRTCEKLIKDLPQNSTVAVLSISSNDRDSSAFALDEIEFQMVDAKKFKMVDRKTLDTIRQEQQFQMSGEVSDASAISIGNMLGASIVMTGSITGSGNSQRLTVKALDVKTAQIVVMTREQF
jgi:curli biogenesis system outer membrane secretion channel CsgG